MRFLLVDRIHDWHQDQGIRGAKNVSITEDYFEHHFPRRPVVPGILLVEALVQLAGWFEAVSSGFERWLLLDSVVRCGLYDFVLPGDRVELQVTPDAGQIGDVRTFHGLGLVDGTKKISADFRCTPVPLGDLDDPERFRERYARLSRQVSW